MKRKLTCTNYFTGKKDFQESTQKNLNANVWARPDVTVWAVGYPPPHKFKLAFHIYYVKYENTLMCKRISWDSGGMMF